MANRHLIYQTAFIGDLLLSTPLIREFRKLYAGDRIVLACRKGAGQLFIDLGLVDEVVEVDKNVGASRRQFSRDLLKEPFNIVLCPHESFRTAWLMKRIRAQRKVGFEKWWNGFAFTDRINRPMHWPEALRQLSLLRALNISVADQFERSVGSGFLTSEAPRSMVKKWNDRIPKFAQLYTPSNRDYAKKTQENIGVLSPSVFVAPGSVWPTKMWKEKYFVEIVRKLAARSWNVYLTGSGGEAALCERIVDAVKAAEKAEMTKRAALDANTVALAEDDQQQEEIGDRTSAAIKKFHGVGEVRSLAGKTSLTELHALMSLSKFVVSNDSSPIHLAAMAGVPSVAIFGPTTLNLGYRPWDDRSKVAQVDLSCRPCGKHGHVKCPLGTHACMEQVTVATVESLIREVEAELK